MTTEKVENSTEQDKTKSTTQSVDNDTLVEAKKEDKGKEPSKGKGNRKLGDEWMEWDGTLKCEEINSPQKVFLLFALGVNVLVNVVMYGLLYLIAPRLSQFHSVLPILALVLFVMITSYFIFWYVVLLLTSYTEMKLHFLGRGNRVLIGFLLDKVFILGELIKYNRDKLGNSFVKVANNFTMGTKKTSGKEKLLLLLPRCLTKESYQSIRAMSKEYNIEMAVCTGGEIARKKIKEYRPTAVIGVACERDLVSGIKDVGGKVSVLGIPNIRPEGPCKNTFIDLEMLKKDIEFYLPEHKS
ncbi:MAG: DUF116 domain-containing protein [Spirochaetota bacterium]|nr:DUF116 domain-containing protein [Spirochaetota bacterium]